MKQTRKSWSGSLDIRVSVIEEIRIREIRVFVEEEIRIREIRVFVEED